MIPKDNPGCRHCDSMAAGEWRRKNLVPDLNDYNEKIGMTYCECKKVECSHVEYVPVCIDHAFQAMKESDGYVRLYAQNKADLLNQVHGMFKPVTTEYEGRKHKVAGATLHHLYTYLVDRMWDKDETARNSPGYVMDSAASIRSIARGTSMDRKTVGPALQALDDMKLINFDNRIVLRMFDGTIAWMRKDCPSFRPQNWQAA
jgi:hypothetical protein